MKYLPDITVIVCAFNHEKWIERCIRSINHQDKISQDFFEILVVDDGSTDNTYKILEQLSLYINNLRIIKNEKNIGLPESLNIAIKSALGRYVVRVDSDDYVARSFLYIMSFFLDSNRQYQAVAVDYVTVDCFENTIERANCFEKTIACGIMFRKECLFDIGLYNEEFKMREGHDLRERFIKKFKIARLEFPLYKYRQHEENRTKNKTELQKYDEKLEKCCETK